MFTRALESLRFRTLMGSFYPKWCKVFKRNWLFVSKLTWEIWKILTWVLESLKDFQFNELLLNKVYIAWDKKVQRSYLSWQRRVIKNAERNWFVVSKLTWEICQILTWALGSLKIFTLTGSFWAKYILFEPEKCR